MARKGLVMKQVPVAAFKDRVSEYVAEAAAGEEIIITKHGKEAARLVPPRQDKAAMRKQAVERMIAFGEKYRAKYGPTSTDALRALLDESRP
jgi:prevent-host-death family protein